MNDGGLEERKRGLEFRKLDHEDVKLAVGEVQSSRDHELAMNPPAEPEATAKPAAGVGGGDLEERVDALAESVSEISQLLTVIVHKLGPALSGEQSAPPTPAAAPPDYVPQLLDILKMHAGKKQPIGTKRTPEGMQMIYETPPEEPPPEMPPV